MSVNLVGYLLYNEEKKTSHVVLVFASQGGIADIMKNIYSLPAHHWAPKISDIVSRYIRGGTPTRVIFYLVKTVYVYDVQGQGYIVGNRKNVRIRLQIQAVLW